MTEDLILNVNHLSKPFLLALLLLYAFFFFF